MFYSAELDLVANGIGVTNFILLSGLLLTLPCMLLPTIMPTLGEFFDKYMKINIIEEQLKGDGNIMKSRSVV